MIFFVHARIVLGNGVDSMPEIRVRRRWPNKMLVNARKSTLVKPRSALQSRKERTRPHRHFAVGISIDNNLHRCVLMRRNCRKTTCSGQTLSRSSQKACRRISISKIPQLEHEQLTRPHLEPQQALRAKSISKLQNAERREQVDRCQDALATWPGCSRHDVDVQEAGCGHGDSQAERFRSQG